MFPAFRVSPVSPVSPVSSVPVGASIGMRTRVLKVPIVTCSSPRYSSLQAPAR